MLVDSARAARCVPRRRGGRTMTLLELRGAGFAYGSRRVLDDVSLRIDEGDSLGLVGESGAGQVTILRLMLGLAAPRDGQVLFEAPRSLCATAHRCVGSARACSRCSRIRIRLSTLANASTGSSANRSVRWVWHPAPMRSAASRKPSTRSGSPPTPHVATRTSSPEDSVSASRSRAPWSRAPGCCWPTSRSAHST